MQGNTFFFLFLGLFGLLGWDFYKGKLLQLVLGYYFSKVLGLLSPRASAQKLKTFKEIKNFPKNNRFYK